MYWADTATLPYRLPRARRPWARTSWPPATRNLFSVSSTHRCHGSESRQEEESNESHSSHDDGDELVGMQSEARGDWSRSDVAATEAAKQLARILLSGRHIVDAIVHVSAARLEGAELEDLQAGVSAGKVAAVRTAAAWGTVCECQQIPCVLDSGSAVVVEPLHGATCGYQIRPGQRGCGRAGLLVVAQRHPSVLYGRDNGAGHRAITVRVRNEIPISATGGEGERERA
jgi:hypothetical protein